MHDGGHKISNRTKIAFVKFGGLSSGGTEKWLQMMAANMNPDLFEVTYFYCDSAPYIGSDYKHPTTDVNRFNFLSNSKVSLVRFHVGAKDITTEDHNWVDSNFWDKFDEASFDIVITGKAGPAEYPFTRMTIPVIEYVTLGVGVDQTPSIKWSIHCSEWQRRRWIRMGGQDSYSSSLPVPYFNVSCEEDYRVELGIPENSFVIGMHQRAEDTIYSSIPLSAFDQLSEPDTYFLLMGGSKLYGEQAKRLGATKFINLPHTADENTISKFLNTLDVFAHGRSDGETFGTVFAEAMAHGLPIITHYSKHGANAQAETIGPAGKCVSSTKEYVEFLSELRHNSLFYKILNSKALEYSEANFSLSSIVDRFETIVLGVLNGTTANTIAPRFSFGRSPLGFLQYGELENPASIAHHIVENTFPEKYDLLIAGHFLKRSKVFYDVGANIGLYCLLGPHLNSRLEVYCFEPQKVCVEQLQQSIYLNNWEHRMNVYEFALSDKEDEVELYLAGTETSIELNFVGETQSKPINIRTRRLDDLELRKPDFIKIDVEGHEYNMLLGASQTIIANQPVIFLELVHNIPSRNYINPNFSKTLQLLFELDYSVYRSDGKGFLRRIRNDNSHDGVLMYLCVPKSRSFESILKIRILLARSRFESVLNKAKYYFRKNVICLLRKF